MFSHTKNNHSLFICICICKYIYFLSLLVYFALKIYYLRAFLIMSDEKKTEEICFSLFVSFLSLRLIHIENKCVFEIVWEKSMCGGSSFIDQFISFFCVILIFLFLYQEFSKWIIDSFLFNFRHFIARLIAVKFSSKIRSLLIYSSTYHFNNIDVSCTSSPIDFVLFKPFVRIYFFCYWFSFRWIISCFCLDFFTRKIIFHSHINYSIDLHHKQKTCSNKKSLW